MAKRKRVAKRTRALPSREELKTFVRTEGLRYLAVKNINSVGIGRKISTKGPSGALCVQFTVDRKTAAEHLESLGSRLIPPQFVIGGKVVPSDVIERRFCPSWQPVTEVALQKEERKTRQNIVSPGLSIAHRGGVITPTVIEVGFSQLETRSPAALPTGTRPRGDRADHRARARTASAPTTTANTASIAPLLARPSRVAGAQRVGRAAQDDPDRGEEQRHRRASRRSTPNATG